MKSRADLLINRAAKTPEDSEAEQSRRGCWGSTQTYAGTVSILKGSVK